MTIMTMTMMTIKIFNRNSHIPVSDDYYCGCQLITTDVLLILTSLNVIKSSLIIVVVMVMGGCGR